MKYYIRTTGERDLSQYAFLNATPLFDYEHKPVKSFIEQMRNISDDDSLFMEDDIIFCKDFEKRLKEAITEYPNMVINFYYQPLTNFPKGEIKGNKFLFNQCVYYPKGISKIIADKMEELVNDGIKWTQYDEIEGAALNELNIDFINYRPMLVQHIGKSSLLGNNFENNNAESIFFIDDLEKYNVNYNNEKALENYANFMYLKLGLFKFVSWRI